MIESIEISGVATSEGGLEILNKLSKFNFIYGSNGSGKTTVSRVIANEADHPTCRLTWKRGTKLQTMVYNRNCVAKNFGPAAELKGIFTLGEKNADTINKIATAKIELDKLTKAIEGCDETLKGTDGISGKRGGTGCSRRSNQGKVLVPEEEARRQIFECVRGVPKQFRAFQNKGYVFSPPREASPSAGHGGAAYALARQPEGTSAGSSLGSGVLSIQAMTAPCR